MSAEDSKGDEGMGSGRSQLDLFDELNHSYFNDKPSDSTFSKKEGPHSSQKDLFTGKSDQSSTQQPITGPTYTTSTLRSREPVDNDVMKVGLLSSSDPQKDRTQLPSSPNQRRLPAKTYERSLGATNSHHNQPGCEHPYMSDHQQAASGQNDFSKANTSTKASFSGAKPPLGDKLTATAFGLQGAPDPVRPAPSAEEVAKFEQMIRKSSCRKTTIMFSMEWLGVKVKSACMLRGLNDLLTLADEQTEGSAANLNHTKVMVSNCTKLLNNLYSQAHTKMSVETDPAKKQLIELGMDEKIGLIRFHVSISQFRQSFNSLTNLAVRLCQKKGKSLYNEVMTVSRVNVVTLEQEVIYKVGTQTGEQMQLSNKPPLSKVVDEDSGGSDSQKPEGPQTKVYKKDGHKDGKLVQSYEVAVEEQRNGFYSSTASNVKNGEKKTLLWEAKYPHAPGLDIVIYFLVIKEISPILFWSMKREISSKQLNDIERYGQMIKIYLLPQDEKLKASRVFDFTTGKQIEDELIGMELPPEVSVKQPQSEPVPTAARPSKEQHAATVTAPSYAPGSEMKLSVDPMDEIIFQRRDMILQNPFCLSQLQPRQILILIEQVIDRNHTIRYLNLGETFRRADYYRQQVSVRAVINACAKITLHHLKKIHGMEFKVLRLKLGEEHYSSRLFFDAKAIPGRQPETATMEYPDYDGLIFSESIHLLHLVFKEQLEYLNVKEYVGRLKTSFEKPFMLTANISAPMSFAQKEIVKPRAPPAPVVSAPITSKTKSLLADLDQYTPAVKQPPAPEVNSAGKGLQPKHLQSGSHVLQRLAMLASVSRGNPEDELDSGRTSLEKMNRLLPGEGKKAVITQKPLKQVAGIVKPQKLQEAQQPTHPSGSSCDSESSGELEGSFQKLGKRKDKQQQRDNKRPKEFLTSSKGTSDNKLNAGTGSVSAGKLAGGLPDWASGKKTEGSWQPAESIQDSRPEVIPIKPKRKIKITKEDIQTIQVISAGIDKPPISQDLKTSSKRSSQEPASAKKQIYGAINQARAPKAIESKTRTGSGAKVNDQLKPRTKAARNGQDAIRPRCGPDSEDSFSRNPSNQGKPKDAKLPQAPKGTYPDPLKDSQNSAVKGSKRKPTKASSPEPVAELSIPKPQKPRKNQASGSKQTTKEKKSQQTKTNKPQHESDSSDSPSVQSLPSHDFNTSEEESEESEESEQSEESEESEQAVPERTGIVRKRDKVVRVSPVARKTPTRITCEPSLQDVEAVEATTYTSNETSDESSGSSNPEPAETTSEESDSSERVVYKNQSRCSRKKPSSASSARDQTSASDMVIVLADEENPFQTGTKPGTLPSADSTPTKVPYPEPQTDRKTESQPKFMARLADLHKRMAGKTDESDRYSQPRVPEQVSSSTAKIRNRASLPKEELRGSNNSDSQASLRSDEDNRRLLRDHSVNHPTMLNKRQPAYDCEPNERVRVVVKPIETDGTYPPRRKAQIDAYPPRPRDSRMTAVASHRHVARHSSPETKRPFHRPEAPHPSSSTRYLQHRESENYKSPSRHVPYSRIKQEVIQSVRRHSPVAQFETISSNSREDDSRSSSEQPHGQKEAHPAVSNNYHRGEGRGVPRYRGRGGRPPSAMRNRPYD